MPEQLSPDHWRDWIGAALEFLMRYNEDNAFFFGKNSREGWNVDTLLDRRVEKSLSGLLNEWGINREKNSRLCHQLVKSCWWHSGTVMGCCMWTSGLIIWKRRRLEPKICISTLSCTWEMRRFDYPHSRQCPPSQGANHPVLAQIHPPSRTFSQFGGIQFSSSFLGKDGLGRETVL